ENANALGGTPHWTELAPVGASPSPRRGAAGARAAARKRPPPFGGPPRGRGTAAGPRAAPPAAGPRGGPRGKGGPRAGGGSRRAVRPCRSVRARFASPARLRRHDGGRRLQPELRVRGRLAAHGGAGRAGVDASRPRWGSAASAVRRRGRVREREQPAR